jgi:branched-chain amino acid transport system substrate-binding protein
VWRTNPTARDFSSSQVDFITNWVAGQLGKPPAEVTVSIAHEDSDYGTSVAASFKKLATEAGIQLVSVEPYASTSSDLSSVVFRLRQADPDIVIAVSYAQDAILLSRQAYELELKKPFFGTGGGHSLKSFQEALGSKADGILNVDFTQYQVKTDFTPGLEEFLALYRETFKEEPKSGHSLANYMGAKVVFDILEKSAGSLEPDKIREAAMALDIPEGATATGWGVKFDDNGQNTRAKPLITQWRDGELVTVWPEQAAMMPPIMPE